jgi:hypothetical protein
MFIKNLNGYNSRLQSCRFPIMDGKTFSSGILSIAGKELFNLLISTVYLCKTFKINPKTTEE